MQKLIGRILLAALAIAGGVVHAQQSTPVRVKKQGGSYVLQNAYVTVVVDRTTGDMKSMKYMGEEMMGFVSGHHGGYWEQNPSHAAQLSDGVSIDPEKNGGDRAEIFVKGIANGQSILGPEHPLACDLEIRYSLGRDDHGVYTYAIFSHPAEYPATSLGESRFGMKLNGAVFDWLSIDSQRNQAMPTGYDWDHGQQLNMKEARRLTTGAFAGNVEHKYDYSTNLFENPAFGWSSTRKHIGLFLVNPSNEYLSGGPTKVELTGHLDDDAGGDPTLLDYWRSSHYGGSHLDLAAGEAWTKVVGPILVYVNNESTPQAIFADARREAARQRGLWPFAWVSGVDYPAAQQRAGVEGKLAVHDSQPNALPVSNMVVGLIPLSDADGGWQTDAKNYQFWVRASADGAFTIPDVRPGTYELHALADGVLGEYAGQKLMLTAGQHLSLGNLEWKPLRYGKQLWEIGVPNRKGSEFYMGDKYFHWGMYLLYAKLFPNDVDYTIGKSDFHKDWYFEQVPNLAHGDQATYTGGDTAWKIRFTLNEVPAEELVLRAAICGVGARHVFVSINGHQAGDLAPLTYNATINRDGIEGFWSEHDLRFPASMLKPGENLIELSVPKGNVMSGVIYDYLRLEAVENSDAALSKEAPSAAPQRP